MKLSELFVKEAMDLQLSTTDKPSTLKYLAERFHQAGGVSDVDAYVAALEERIKYFVQHGCKASDISFGEIQFRRASENELNEILQKVFKQEEITFEEVEKWQTEVFLKLCSLYKK